MTVSIASILSRKGSEIWSVEPEATVYAAIALMAQKGVGAMLVVSGGKLVGIVSERDYARKVMLLGRTSKDTLVKDIMTSKVITAKPDYTIEDCMRIVTHNHIRHLPVLEGEKLVGIVSIGDLVNEIIESQAHTIDQLNTYISGKYPA
jgi:CBS domain-containing protein